MSAGLSPRTSAVLGARRTEKDMPPKICLINPVLPDSLWSFRGVRDLLGKRGGFAPLGLATIAGCTPPQYPLQMVDEEIEPIPWETDADIVALTAFNVQAPRAFEIAARFRRQGKLVVLGGPYASLCPDRCQPHVDVLFVGEAELVWKQFLDDYQRDQFQPRYTQIDKVAMTSSPLPRFDLLKIGEYTEATLQTTRGCPFACEFCDIIVTDGRIPRSKSVPQVMAEITRLHEMGAGSILFTDANFVGNPKYAKALLTEMVRFGQQNRFPISFGCEATVNLAGRRDLLELMKEAQMDRVFIGIESPRTDSLLETGKKVNTRGSLLNDVATLQSYGIYVVAGMIVGFDNDDKAIFQEQLDFLTEAAIPFTTAGTLMAIENTPLYARLENEQRILGDGDSYFGHGANNTNFVPRQMTNSELQTGYNWLIRSLYRYDRFAGRSLEWLDRFQPTGRRRSEFRRPLLPGFLRFSGTRHRSLALLKTLKLVLHYYLATRDPARRRFFLFMVRKALRRRPFRLRLVWTLALVVFHKHCRDYVCQTQGDPETIADEPPFASSDHLSAARGAPAVRQKRTAASAP